MTATDIEPMAHWLLRDEHGCVLGITAISFSPTEQAAWDAIVGDADTSRTPGLYVMQVSDRDWQDTYREHFGPCNVASRAEKAQLDVDAFNAAHPVHTPVRYWTGVRQGPGVSSQTRTRAQVLSGHTAVVWVEGHGSCIALTHIQPEGAGR